MNGCTVNRSYRDDYPVSFWTFDPSSLIFSVQVLQPAFSSLYTTTYIYIILWIHVNYLDYITVSLGMILLCLLVHLCHTFVGFLGLQAAKGRSGSVDKALGGHCNTWRRRKTTTLWMRLQYVCAVFADHYYAMPCPIFIGIVTGTLVGFNYPFTQCIICWPIFLVKL